jgi:hypothetical protein
MKSNYSEFIINLQNGAEVWAGMFLFIAITIFIFYIIGLFLSNKRTNIYEYVSSREISAFLNVMIFVSLSLTLYVNSLFIGEFKTINNAELIVQSISSMIIGVIFWYVTYVIIKIYYPYILSKHLASIRFKSMHSKSTGNKMRLLNEDEEDVHLTKEQIEHEEIFAFDYDVWIDDITGEKIVEKYDVHHTSIICDKCRFRTLHEVKEEVVNEPTQNEEGLLKKYYKCDNCGHKEEKEKHISPLSEN